MMNNSKRICKTELRRHAVRASTKYNGLDYLEVIGKDQKTLIVRFLEKAPESITANNIKIEGGRRIRNIKVESIKIERCEDSELDDCLKIFVDKAGDFSTYTLRMVAVDEQGRPTDKNHPDFDPRYAYIKFNFKADCPTDLDCKPKTICPIPERKVPEINYLAKDYASFRQLILDRLALLIPDWQERHVPDIGITLVELLAYMGDYLSYYQDAVMTEAYLGTARQRISVRRHARLVDYRIHEGCNARTWIHVKADEEVFLFPDDFYFITRHKKLQQDKTILTSETLTIPPHEYEVFEPLVENPKEKVYFFPPHNEIYIYTWGNEECCIPKGATRATLKDEWLCIPISENNKKETGEKNKGQESSEQSNNITHKKPECERALRLKVGDFLLFEEVKDPETGSINDADPNHRQIVRLTRVEPIVDDLFEQPVVEIEWAEEDKLRFPLCLSNIGSAPACDLITNVCVARGNILLVDHGRRIDDPESLGEVPIKGAAVNCRKKGNPTEPVVIPGEFNPHLQKRPLTYGQPLSSNFPAGQMLIQDPRLAVPRIELTQIFGRDDRLRLIHISKPSAFVIKLRDSSDELSTFFRDKFSLHIKKFLEAYIESKPPSESFLKTILDELNQIMKSYNFFHVLKLAESAVTDEIREIAGKNPTGEKLFHLNQLIMQIAYSKEFLHCDKRFVHWYFRHDLLDSGSEDRHFVVEIDNQRQAHLRFGNGELGKQPEPGTNFQTLYRIGSGPAGNVGAETICHIVCRTSISSGIKLYPRNPLPAQGGTAPESLKEVKVYAPHTFRKRLERAMTAEDYARLAEKHPKVQKAGALLRWTGSWYAVIVAIDQLEKPEAEPELLEEIFGYLYRYRRIGHDLVVEAAQHVPLEITMIICVLPSFMRGHVKAALMDVFSNRELPNGKFGFFHPDNLTFGKGIFISKLVAEAKAVPGVENVIITKLERYKEGPNGELENGVLPLGPREISRLDNDPNFPENGKIEFELRGRR